MKEQERTELLIGKDAVDILRNSAVAVFGLGGVGSYAVEALARTGVGKLLLCDGDVYDETNINRQLYALHSTVGRKKTEVAAERIKDINPNIEVVQIPCFYGVETVDLFSPDGYNYVVDAIDCVSSKILLVEKCVKADTPIISCMGTGLRTDSQSFKVADIYETNYCPLAKVMRKELRSRGIQALKVVFSTQQPMKAERKDGNERIIPSIAFCPASAGLLLAQQTVLDLIEKGNK